MFGAIILRDSPKREAQMDIWRYRIKGGFRGFRQVLPGLHYAAVKDGSHDVGLWCRVKPGEVVVRIFDGGVFKPDEPDSAAQYTQMALSGAMNHALLSYPVDKFSQWLMLVNHIDPADSLPVIHGTDQGTGSRFEKAFKGTHQGDQKAFLAEFQFSLASWLVNPANEKAMTRWRHLLNSIYNASEMAIAAQPDLFVSLVDVMLAQFKVLPDTAFGANSVVTTHASYMVEDMSDTGIPALVEKSKEFAAYFKERNS